MHVLGHRGGLVGAVVVLMGVIAFNPMLRAGYDVKLAAGVITAGGTLGILIPPSVMIIVYAAVAGQSVVKLYAAAMFPGFFLALLYLVYVVGWAMINPKIAPKLPEEQTRVPVPAWIARFQETYSRNMFVGACSRRCSRRRKAMATRDRRRAASTYWALVTNFARFAGAVPAHRRHAWRWCGGTSSSISRRRRGRGRGLQQLGAPATTGAATPADKGPPLAVLRLVRRSSLRLRAA